jgi:hypothetical protein
MILFLDKLPINAGWDWTAIGVICSLVGLVITWIITWRMHLSVDRYKRSEFYLNQIKTYLANAVDLLQNGGNNNVQWHQATQLLKNVEHISKQLTELTHKHIYFTDYIDASYRIADILWKISDFKFYYGISDFEGKDSGSLYRESMPKTLDKPHYRIAPESLRYLCRVIDKATKASFDLNENRSDWKVCFDSKYFQKEITGDTIKPNELSPLLHMSKPIKTIFNYLNNFDEHSHL